MERINDHAPRLRTLAQPGSSKLTVLILALGLAGMCGVLFVMTDLYTRYKQATADSRQLSILLADCANGKIVSFDGKVMECRLTELVPGIASEVQK